MTAPAAQSVSAVPQTIRVRVFVDYWNFQLTLNEREAAARHLADFRFLVDWKKLGPWLAKKACGTVGVANHTFDGVIIYTSYNPATAEGKKFKNWALTWLDRQPGVSVHCRERKPRSAFKCPACHQPITVCPHGGCGKTIASTIEKGVDTLIATDMIRLAWEGAYDVGVLASMDSDLMPAVEFLALRGRKIIQAGFPPKGTDLATACWASFDVFADRKEIERAGP
ncbi:MAG: NYN domain-containing protein [Acidobacteria bacterium]|nr:NYN domain-containing protein [Acidobacteriota bacterium]